MNKIKTSINDARGRFNRVLHTSEYDGIHADAEQLQRLMDFLEVKPGDRILDLGTGNGYLNITTPSSTQKEEKKAQMMDRMILKALVNIGGGLRQYIHSPKRVFSLSQEKRVSLT